MRRYCISTYGFMMNHLVSRILKKLSTGLYYTKFNILVYVSLSQSQSQSHSHPGFCQRCQKCARRRCPQYRTDES